MDQKNLPAENGQTSKPEDKTELNHDDLEQVSGGILIGLLLPAVQKVREAASHSWGDPHINGVVQKGK